MASACGIWWDCCVVYYEKVGIKMNETLLNVFINTLLNVGSGFLNLLLSFGQTLQSSFWNLTQKNNIFLAIGGIVLIGLVLGGGKIKLGDVFELDI